MIPDRALQGFRVKGLGFRAILGFYRVYNMGIMEDTMETNI